MNIICYIIEDKIYVNLTNKCNNDCIFCIRNLPDGINGYNLWLDAEPSAKQIIEDLIAKDFAQYKEVVFCGYGEPLYRYEEIKEVSLFVKSKGIKTRINTNGQVNYILGKDISNDIGKYIDYLNISLNATNKVKYNLISRPASGESAFDDMLNFAKNCVGKVEKVILSVVDCIGADEIEKARNIANDIGATLKIRKEIQ